MNGGTRLAGAERTSELRRERSWVRSHPHSACTFPTRGGGKEGNLLRFCAFACAKCASQGSGKGRGSGPAPTAPAPCLHRERAGKQRFRALEATGLSSGVVLYSASLHLRQRDSPRSACGLPTDRAWSLAASNQELHGAGEGGGLVWDGVCFHLESGLQLVCIMHGTSGGAGQRHLLAECPQAKTQKKKVSCASPVALCSSRCGPLGAENAKYSNSASWAHSTCEGRVGVGSIAQGRGRVCRSECVFLPSATLCVLKTQRTRTQPAGRTPPVRGTKGQGLAACV